MHIDSLSASIPSSSADTKVLSRRRAHTPEGDLYERLAATCLRRSVRTLEHPTLAALDPGYSGMQPFRLDVNGGQIFAKVAKTENTAKLQKERLFSVWAASEVGVSPPVRAHRVCAHRDGDHVMLTDFFAGRPLCAQDAHDDALMRRVFALLHRLHDARAPAFAGLPIGRAQKVRRSVEIAQGDKHLSATLAAVVLERVAVIEERLMRLGERHTPVHGDFQQRNVLVSHDSVRLIDFADAGIGEPMTDLAHFALDAELPMQQMPRWIALYEPDKTLQAEHLPRLQLCMALYRLRRFAEWNSWEPGGAHVANYRARIDDDARTIGLL